MKKYYHIVLGILFAAGTALAGATPVLAAPFRPTSFQTTVVPINNYLRDATPSFNWNHAVANEVAISHYEFKIDDGAFVNIGYVAGYTTPELQDGRHTFTLRTVDVANHVSEDVLLEVGTDTTAPATGAMSPTTAVQNAFTTFTIHPIDNVEIKHCTYAINSVFQGEMDVNANWDFSAQVIFSGLGNQYIRTVCYDIADNYVGSDHMISVTPQSTPVDNTISSINSLISTSKSVLKSDNYDSAVISVTVRNAAGQPFVGKTVSLQSSRPNQDVIFSSSPITNINGVATFTVRSFAAGSSLYRPVVENSYVTDGITIVYEDQVTVSNSYSSTYVNKTSVNANNSDAATITVTVRNSSNAVIPNKLVTLTSSRASYDNIISSPTYTNSSGQATFTVRSWVAGTSVYRPIVDGLYLNNDISIYYYSTAVDANAPSTYYSTVSPSKSYLVANSGEVSVITVQVKNGNNVPLSGKTVTVQSNRNSYDTIINNSPVTNSQGYASFYVRSTQPGTSTYSVIADNVWLSNAVVTYSNAGGISPILPSNIAPGSLIKLECPPYAGVNDACRAVYFVGSDNKRHAFSHSKIYFSWYTDFGTVQSVNGVTMSSFMIGKNMGYRPGVRLVKFTSSPVVYAVSSNNMLRAITSEAVAKNLYGAGWAKKIDDISDAFMGDYQFGVAVDSNNPFNPTLESANKPNPLTNGY